MLGVDLGIDHRHRYVIAIGDFVGLRQMQFGTTYCALVESLAVDGGDCIRRQTKFGCAAETRVKPDALTSVARTVAVPSIRQRCKVRPVSAKV